MLIYIPKVHNFPKELYASTELLSFEKDRPIEIDKIFMKILLNSLSRIKGLTDSPVRMDLKGQVTRREEIGQMRILKPVKSLLLK